MSGFLSAASTLAQGILSWRQNLRPSSFRGVPFYVDGAAGSGGRRIAEHQYAQRDVPYYEDLGQQANKYRIEAWVVGDNYLQNSRDLIAACQDYDTPAILVHPWRGEIRCRATTIRWAEHKDRGGYCTHEIEFVVDTGGLPIPTQAQDSVSTLLSRIASAVSVVVSAYQEVSLIVQHPSLLIGFVGSLLGDVAGDMLDLPAGTGVGLGAAIAALTSSPSDDGATGAAVQSVFQAAAQNAITALTPAAQSDDPVAGITLDVVPAADRSGGLAALATWGNDQAVPAASIQATQLQAVQALVQGQAVLAVLTVYASLDWPSADAAQAARVQVQAMLDAQLDLAAQLGADDLYRAWQAVEAAALTDLIRRAQALPSVVTFTLGASLPSLALAQRWYQDADRADELDALNDVPDPLFMPFDGVRLSA